MNFAFSVGDGLKDRQCALLYAWIKGRCTDHVLDGVVVSVVVFVLGVYLGIQAINAHFLCWLEFEGEFVRQIKSRQLRLQVVNRYA